MRIAELVGPRDFRIVASPVPEPTSEEVLVRVQACGVCASELSQWTGTTPAAYPSRIGHEVSGTVASVGAAVRTYTIGDRVGVWTGGAGYADYVAAREDHCRPMPADQPLEYALLEPIACASNAVELADVRLADSVVIIGAGFMGLLVVQLVALRGARQIIVADTRADALQLAITMGATRVVNVTEETLADAVRELTGGRGTDVTFEVTGAQSALDVIGDVTRMSGKLVLVGFHQGDARRIPLGQWNWMAFDLRNAHFRDEVLIMRGMSVAAALLAAGQLQMAPLITHRFAPGKINDAFAAAVAKPKGFVKAVIDFGQEGDGRRD